ncbi:MAG: YdcF family protein [Limisphaerales bacterium]
MDANRTYWGLFRRRTCLVPTWRGGLALVLGSALLLALGLQGVYPFLALNAPRPGGVLVIEGWVPDSVLEAGFAEFNRHHYDKVFITGTPIEQGGFLSIYGNHADLCAATLLKLGMNSNVLQSVPTPVVSKDRTYASAVALRQWWRAHGMAPTNVNLLSLGPHARRSRLLFRRALGKEVTVGVVALSAGDYDARHWWRTSQGFRSVTGELIAYCYVRALFWRFARA